MEEKIKTRKFRNLFCSFDPLVADISIEDAEQMRKINKGEEQDFYNAILTAEEFTNFKVREREYFLQGLIAYNTINIINGYRGCGKSFFALAIANAISWGIDLGPWKIKHSGNVLLVDGEMALETLHERLSLFQGKTETKKRTSELFIYPEAYAYRIGLDAANLTNKKWRDTIAANVKDLRIEVLILDNLSSLAPGIDENSKMEFDVINHWLMKMRFDEVTIIMTHHTGKSGEQRGTSAHEDHADMCYLLSRTNGNNDVGCNFTLSATKDRPNIFEKKRFDCELIENENNKLEFVFDVELGNQIKKAIDFLKLNPDATEHEAKVFNISRPTFYRAKSWLKNTQKSQSQAQN